MAEYTLELLEAEKAVADFIPAVGIVAMRWTQVETATIHLLALMANVHRNMEPALGAHIPDRTATDIIAALALEWALPEEIKAQLAQFGKTHSALRENRNLIVHSCYIKSEPGIEPERSALTRVTARGKTKISYFEVTPEELYRVSIEILNFAGYTQRLCDHLEALRAGKEPPPLPEPPARPDSLQDSLPQLLVHDLLLPRSFGRGYTGWGGKSDLQQGE